MTVVGDVGPQLAPGRAPLTYRRLYQHGPPEWAAVTGGSGAAEWSGDSGGGSHCGGKRDLRAGEPRLWGWCSSLP